MMVVINGDSIKEKDPSNDATPMDSKLEEDHQLDHSSFSAPNKLNSNMTLQTGTNNNTKTASESDLYDDVDPVNTTNSNSGSTSAQFTLAGTYSNIEMGADSEANSKKENDVGKGLSLSDTFGQLVSDTLTDTFDDVDNDGNETNNCNLTETALQGTTLQRAAPEESLQQSSNECNGKAVENQITSDPAMQGEVIFRTADSQVTMSSLCSQGDSNHEYGDLDEEEDYEDESGASDEFDEDEYRAAQLKHKAKAGGQMPQKKGNGEVLETSIMVIESEEEEEEGEEEECDEEEVDDEEDDQLEEEESDQAENVQGRADEAMSSQDEYVPEISNPNNSISEHSFSHTSSAKNNGDIPHNVKSAQLSHLPRSVAQEETIHSKERSCKYNNYPGRLTESESSNGHQLGQQLMKNSSATGVEFENMARDHSSFMKKVKFSQQLNSLKRRGILFGAKQGHESDEDLEDLDEKEGWEELEKWNQMRLEEMNYKMNPTELTEKQKQEIIWNRQQSQLKASNCKRSICEVSTPDQKTAVPAADRFTTSASTLKPLPQKLASKPPSILEAKPPIVSESQSSIIPPIVSLIPQLNEAKGYFEMGLCNPDDPQLSMHVFSVTIIFARGLNKVIPGAVLRSCREGPHFSYSLLGCVVHTDPIADINNPLFSAEKANARIFTTTTNVSSYLAQHNILTVTLMIGEIQLAKCSVDISELSNFATIKNEGEGSSKKVSGAYELKPVPGNMAAEARPDVEALLGLAVELQKLPRSSPCQNATVTEPKASCSKQDAADYDTKEQHHSRVMSELASLSKKRERHDSGGRDNSSQNFDSSLALKEAREKLKADLNPPAKKRKLSDTGGEKKIYSSDDASDDQKSKFWEEAEADLQNWRRAQENVFWKQWLVREKRLQETLSEEWRQRMAGLEEELTLQMQEVQYERASLEDEWRTLRDREGRVRRREEQLLELQEEVFQQQAELGAQLRLGAGPSPPQRRAIAMSRNASTSQLGGANSSNSLLEHKQYYKSQWLRGVATTHRKWATERGASSSNVLLPSGGSRRLSGGDASHCPTTSFVSPLREAGRALRATSKYDTDIIEEISRLTKERRSLQSAASPPAQQIADIDKTIQQLMETSGL